MKAYTIIDIETTGGDPRKDRITEIAVFRYEEGEVVDQFTSLVNPGVPIPAMITRITGIDNELVATAPRFFEVAKRIVEITQDAVFVAHNVRFDYSFVQREFRNLGYTYTRKQLCTVRLSRKILPGLKSYSLGKICTHLNIHNDARHRAEGDAQATLTLFQHLLEQQQHNGADTIAQSLKQSIAAVKLPDNLPPEIVTELPEETGVYYFLDEKQKVLYVGKSNNIRKRVLSHFQGAHKSIRGMKLMKQLHQVTYELTGSELVALLLENDEIKRLQPSYNRAQRRVKFQYAIFEFTNSGGFRELRVDRRKNIKTPLALFTSRRYAEASLKLRMKDFQLCPRYCGVESLGQRCFYKQIDQCMGTCVGDEPPAEYNSRVDAAIHALNHGLSENESFLVVGLGRTYDEHSIVWVQNGVFRGRMYMDKSLIDGNYHAICEMIPSQPEHPDVRRIIQGYIRKHPKEVIWLEEE